MKVYRFNISKFFNVGLLLSPGFVYAILALLLSANLFSFTLQNDNLFILNFAQLLSFGVTIAKYAADQMLLAKLKFNEYANLRFFFIKRVLPLSTLFCLFLIPVHSTLTILCLLFCIPIEVFIIVSVLEMNISKKYYQGALISMIGYPLVFMLYIISSYFFSIQQNLILSIFFFVSLVKFSVVLVMRRVKGEKKEILTLSSYVPMQQAGNYILFKADQLFIAANLIPSFFFRFTLPADYLFYSKFTEIFSGIATSLSPMIVSFAKDDTSSISIKRVLRNNIYVFVCLTAILIQILSTIFFLKKIDLLHIYLLFPFIFITILIVPVNIINYELYRIDDLKKSNLLNLISLLIGGLLILINLYTKSVVLFASIIPLQLITFVLVNRLIKSQRNV